MQHQQLLGLSLIRTIAAFSVLFGHIYQFGNWDILDSQKAWLPEIYLPVTTFFVISGFLITWGFLHEEEANGNINILHSYRKRAARILPLYYLGIIIGFAILCAFNIKLQGNPILLLLLQPQVSHIIDGIPFPFWHYWFLGTEILFYLLFPILYKISRKHLLLVLCAIVVSWLIAKFSCYFIFGKNLLYRYLGVTQMDTILLGSITAIIFYRSPKWLKSICSHKLFCLFSWLIFLSTNIWVPMFPAPIRANIIAIISIMVILSCFYGHPILENKITRFTSSISYGIYILHPIIIVACAETSKKINFIPDIAWKGYIITISIILMTIFLATILHKIVKPIEISSH